MRQDYVLINPFYLGGGPWRHRHVRDLKKLLTHEYIYSCSGLSPGKVLVKKTTETVLLFILSTLFIMLLIYTYIPIDAVLLSGKWSRYCYTNWPKWPNSQNSVNKNKHTKKTRFNEYSCKKYDVDKEVTVRHMELFVSHLNLL